jgi:hypothetical protein
MKLDTEKLVNVEQLSEMFEPDSRPTIRTLREWQRLGKIPSIKIGRSVFFEPTKVRKAFSK